MNCKRCGTPLNDSFRVCPGCALPNPNFKEGAQIPQQPRPNYTQSTYTPPTSSQPINNQPTVTGPVAAQNKPTNNSNGKGFSWGGIFFLAIIIVAIVFIVKSCNDSRLEGTWVANDGSSITFSDNDRGYITIDNTMSSDDILDFTYFIDGDELEIKTETTLFNNSKVERFEFEINGDTLELTDSTGEGLTFQKK